MKERGGLTAGAAGRAIQVEPGLPGAGLRLWSEPFLGQETPLEVRSIVATSRGETVVLLGNDVLTVPDPLAQRVREVAAAAAGTKPSHVLVNASHAHSVPPLPGYPLTDPSDDRAAVARWGEQFVLAVETATREAANARRPARLGWGWGSTPIGVYRRQFDEQGHDHLGEVPERPIDRSVGVVRVDDLDGQPIAVLFSASCHAVLHGPVPRETSSDYPGAARGVVERNLGTFGLFLHACGGDINPRYGIGAEEDPHETKDREGMVLGAEVLRVASEIRTNLYRGPRTVLHTLEISGWPWLRVEGHAAPPIRAVARILTLPLSELPPLDVATRIRDENQARLSALEAADASRTDLHIARRWARWSEILLEAVSGGNATVEVPIQALRIGDVAFVAVAMELFSDTGVELRALSPFAHTEVVGYSNGFHGYLPRAQDFPPGGWSALGHYAVPDLYPQAWLQPTAIGPGAEQMVVAACRELLAEIA